MRFSHRFREIKGAGATSFKKILQSRSALTDNVQSNDENNEYTPQIEEKPSAQPPSNSLQATLEKPSDLWGRAEKALRENSNDETRKVMKTYVSILESELAFAMAGMASSDR
ncbi:uncharacterized protein N7500_003664 [Penicillium coprophilum]|uniref:uncharacterized protein n=1 Tax=Penicillium coprophilum TaxID=36646 RepID=UPI0023A332AC|nr:uncharacterized protein N7500_003664 [Penicillium coprophilum]KAJ5170881.1 hypothetical protein N7500_003664 [Penicillium coprophilum]